MSTLATTNIKHPSSASNNIVLDSAGGVDLDALTVSGSAPADSVNIDASGNLLVGTSATDTVGVGSGGAQLQSVAANPFSAARFSNDAFGCVVAIGKSRGASAGSYTVVQNNDILGEIRFAGADGTDLQTVGAQINAEVDGTPGANDLPGRLVLSTTADGASSPTERVRITSAGNVGIGTTSPVGRLDVVGGTIEFDPGLGADSTRAFNFNNGALNFAKLLVPSGSGGALAIHVGASGAVSERARIDNSGRLLIGATAAVSGGDANGRVQVSQDIASNICILVVENTASSGNLSCIRARLRNSSPNSIYSAFLQCDDSTTNRLTLRSNGGIANYSANNFNLSDRNAKKDISPAADTWDCIKEWEIVNYRYKDQSDDADLNLGVIAQQVAESCPEVITVFQEAKEATEDAPAQEERLGVREQQMYWMAIKALQEAQVRIEQLEQRLTDAGIA